jgi:hypothetical protein
VVSFDIWFSFRPWAGFLVSFPFSEQADPTRPDIPLNATALLRSLQRWIWSKETLPGELREERSTERRSLIESMGIDRRLAGELKSDSEQQAGQSESCVYPVIIPV